MLTFQELSLPVFSNWADETFEILGRERGFKSAADIKYGVSYHEHILLSTDLENLKELDFFFRLLELEKLNPSFFLNKGVNHGVYLVARARSFDPLSVIFVDYIQK